MQPDDDGMVTCGIFRESSRDTTATPAASRSFVCAFAVVMFICTGNSHHLLELVVQTRDSA